MAKTTNILDLNNRLEKVEKENVAQNSYTSLKNKPKINSVTLTGNKTLADLGVAATSDITDINTAIGDISDLDTTATDLVGAINEVNDKLDDTGWIQIDTSGVFYRKIDNVVAIRGETLPNTTSWTLLATLPQGCRPIDTFMRALRAVPQDNNLSSLYISQDGGIYVESEVATKFQEIFFIQ